jgi:hypothetical protein
VSQTETEIVQGIGSDYEIKYGFHADENYFFKSGRGLSHELVDAISSHKTSRTGCGSSGTRAWTTSTRGRCRPGAAT